ncbi:mesenchyme-specific cell surface glycoprotein-like [Saccostrea echinata]|uniref:mesenchyme-specific cell surface glycoprotein-like n=1 Tax=Saccostrea echinata TaxID=191078 RepID=UPI002A7FBEF0|nr:mesenchyme-specific cell surface glycoprotein-like [Saccostrea echinata]
MGNKVGVFTDEQIEAYQDCTFFTKKEILRIFSRFRDLAPNAVPKVMSNVDTSRIRLPFQQIQMMTELKENPFCRRICQVFSEDGSGDLSFEDFLDLFSVLSEVAPRELKAVYAFKIYDFDGDNYLGKEDLQSTLKCLTRNELSEEELDFVVEKVLEETDLDDDGKLSYIEFEHVISRSPDFMTYFYIYLVEFTMRLAIILLAAIFTYTEARLQLSRQAYLRFPYQYVNGDPTNPRYGLFQNAAHKAAYHTVDKILYVASARSSEKYLHIIDMNNPASPSILMTHVFDNSVDGMITAVDACSDTIAVSLAAADPVSEGHVELFTPYNRADRVFTRIGRITVGVNPRDIVHTSDCTRLVVANAGSVSINPISSTLSDPEGSVTIIIRNDQGFPVEVNMDFTQLNGRVTDYINNGVRYVFRGDHSAGIINTFSQDLEPESVTISNDDRFAFVSCQRNNAILKIDMFNQRIIELYSLGAKNWTSYTMDASDMNDAANMRHHTVYSFYQPGKLAFGVIDGKGYVVSADTGRTTSYTVRDHGYAFNDFVRARVAYTDGDLDTATMNPTLVQQIQDNQQLGRAFMSNQDGYNIFNKIGDVFLFGGRGISLWDSTTMAHVFDSGDDLERRASQLYPSTFNGDCSNANQSPTQQVDERSDDMGPEPSALAVGTVGTTPVLVTGSRNGVLYVFNMRGVSANFESAHREGSTNDIWNNLYNTNTAGDQQISHIGFVDAVHSATGVPYIYVIGRATGSLSIYNIADVPDTN